MNPAYEIGKFILIIGAVLVVVGALLMFSRGNLPIGNLPGDIAVKRDNWSFYFPITTSIILSIVLTLIFWLISRFNR
ncbi:MAG: DUF2905 domain-containing protein [bacterium]|jgi:ribose/xylose/arabinose/galactoside ABC-type transport system permease subunit